MYNIDTTDCECRAKLHQENLFVEMGFLYINYTLYNDGAATVRTSGLQNIKRAYARFMFLDTAEVFD